MKRTFLLILPLFAALGAHAEPESAAEPADTLAPVFYQATLSSSPFYSYAVPSARIGHEHLLSLGQVSPGDTLTHLCSSTRWGLRSADFPLPSFQLNVGVGQYLPYSDNNHHLGRSYDAAIALTPWQFRLPAGKRAFFHGGWTIGAYTNIMPEHITQKIVWEQIDEHSWAGYNVPTTSMWAVDYEVGALMRLPLAWTFIPRHPERGIWTVGFEPEVRLGYLCTMPTQQQVDPGNLVWANRLNVHLGLNLFAQYRKGNWSVTARAGLHYDAQALYNLNTSLSVGYHF